MLRRQLEADLADVDDADLGRLVIAYEPIWAIGTGRTATPEQAEEAIGFIRELIAARDAEAAAAVRILYGGSVKPDNAAELFSRADIDGGLVGGASLDPGDFLAICEARPVSPMERRRSAVRLPGHPRRLGPGRPGPGNAVSLASTPVFDELWERYPHTTLSAGGRDVGLPDGQMGNSEVGHLNLGAGAVVKQDLARIDDAVNDGSLFENEALLAACAAARESPRGRLHLMGLVSDGGVHSGWTHLEALIELAAQEGVPDLVVHAFTDGRDTLPTSAPAYIEELERWLRHAGRIGTVSGRYYAMDRDRRWERTKLAYDAIVHAEGERAATAAEAVAEAARARADRRVHPPDRDRRLRRGRRRRRRDPLQLPPRPRPAAGDGARRARLRRVRPRRRARARADDADRPTRPSGPTRSPSRRRSRRRRSPRCCRRPASASCTSPRPRSTRT